jgi:hypothetical protein
MKLEYWQLTEMYDDYLNEVYGPIKICGYTYDASHAFKMTDKTAYNMGLSDFLDNQLSEDYLALDDNGDYIIGGQNEDY